MRMSQVRTLPGQPISNGHTGGPDTIRPFRHGIVSEYQRIGGRSGCSWASYDSSSVGGDADHLGGLGLRCRKRPTVTAGFAIDTRRARR